MVFLVFLCGWWQFSLDRVVACWIAEDICFKGVASQMFLKFSCSSLEVTLSGANSSRVQSLAKRYRSFTVLWMAAIPL